MRTAGLAAVGILLSSALGGCAGGTQPPSPAEFRRGVATIEWSLVELDGAPAPTGSGDRRATLRFAADSTRVSGFAGCNQYGGSYTLDADALRFSQLGMTRMACQQGMDLEHRFGEALGRTRRYALDAGQLTLLDESGAVIARFARVGG